MTWKDAEFDKPLSDHYILGSWKDRSGKWRSPIIVYYNEQENRYFSIDNMRTAPLDIDIWHPMPDFPEAVEDEDLCELCKKCQCGKKS